MSGKILLVEDSPTQGETLRATLEGHGFDVQLVTNGEAALKVLESPRAEEYGLVLSDVVMPGMDGYDLCRRIKLNDQLGGVSVVLLTSQTDPMAIVRGLECGADNYVTKPYTEKHLLARVRHALDKYTLRSDAKSSMGVNVKFLDTSFTITSGKEQILDLFISSIEDVVRTNDALMKSQRQLALAQKQLQDFAARMARQAEATAGKYAALMHSASDAIFVLENDGKIADSNARASRLLAETLPLVGKSLLDFVAPASRDRLAGRLKALADTVHVAEPDIEFRQRSGSSVYCDLSGSRALEGSENLSLVILHDVTERRGYEEGLRRSAERLAEAQAIAGMGSFTWDLITNQVFWSEQQYRIYGVGQHFVPTTDYVLQHIRVEDRERVDRAIRYSIETGHPFDCEYGLLRPDKSVRNVRAQAHVRRDEQNRPVLFVGTLLDITDRKQLQEQLLQSQKMDAIGQLAGGIAHDFNNLLTVIHGNSELALSALDPGGQIHQDVSEIKQAAVSAAALTRQLLAFSRRQVLLPQPIQLSSVAAGVEKMLSRLIGEQVDLVLDVDEESGMISADPGQIEQVLINLTVNARDAMPDGGRITVRTAAVEIGRKGQGHTSPLPPGHYELLEVTDTGTGMSEEIREKIFEPFFTTKPAGRGTGLGLSTVHGIVKQSGGELEVMSEIGKGTTFRLYFPRSDATAVAPAAPRASPHARGSETILVVEDEHSLRALARRVLELNGYRVLEAGDGEAAVRIVAAEKSAIDLVVSDVVMPGMNARTMAEQIGAACPDLKILFMSGYHDDHVMLRNFAESRLDFLQKPFTSEELQIKVRDMLDGVAARRAAQV